MKAIFILLTMLIASCSAPRYIAASKGSRAYQVRINQLKDGTYIVTETRYFKVTKLWYECLPDSLVKYL